MSKTPLLYEALLSSLCGIFLISSGCWGSRDNDLEARSTAAEAAAPRRPVVVRESPPAETAKIPQNPPAQLLTPAKQTESTPPIQGTAGHLDSTADVPRINETPFSLIALEPAARNGEQPIALANEPANPLRQLEQPEQPGPVRTLDSSAKPGGRPDVSSPPNTETPPKVRLRPKNKLTDVPFDPVKENGKIFDGWPKPKLALVITGVIEGYIEPCGCAGIDRMKGGMSRRYTMFKTLRRQGWPVVGLDVGGLAHGFGREAEIKFQTLVEAMRKTGYEAIALGASDLHLPAGEIAAVAANLNGQQSPFVSANVGLFGFDTGMTSAYRIINSGGMRIGVTSVLGKTYQKEIKNAEIEMLDPEAAIQKILPKMKQQADYLVLLAHATKDETVALARKFPDFNLVVTSDGQPEPPDKLQKIKDMKTLYVEVGHKGTHAIVLGFYDDPQKKVRYQSVPLDSRFEASPEMKILMAAYQDQLKVLGFAGLGLRAAPQPQKETNGKLVGSAKCESCHEASYAIWKKSLHSEAYDTLVKLDPPRNFDPECISCHVIGWHPTSFFPYQGGFESKEKTPKLTDVGCESCHGPGEKHVAAESGDNEALMQKYRIAVRLTKADAKKSFCVSCHDGDNSPDFNFETYWPLVEHYETTKPDANGQK
ncbi:MAG: multiheme c-type cytochrome [Thermoguttaceae bacterium]